MTTRTEPIKKEDDSLNGLFSCLASDPRRRLLGILHDRAPDPMARQDLATYLAAVHHETPRAQLSNADIEQALLNCHHTHIPKLDAAELLEFGTDRESGHDTVSISGHRAFEDAGIIDAIRTRTDNASCDALFRALADPRRRTILASLNHQFQPIQKETLAREVGAREQGLAESDVATATVEGILATLHHSHLPQLSEADLIEYDRDEPTVAYTGHPLLRVAWLHSSLSPDFRASLTGDTEGSEIGTIVGREKVVAYSQSLVEQAEEELFGMCTATGLLESGCFTRVRDAVRRDIDVYLGLGDPAARAFAHENLPEIVAWEPDTDWLNLPVEGNRVGRVVLVDRKAVLIATLGEENDEGIYEKKAIVGEGADNPLVTMMCQLLGPRLDQITAQTDDIESRLPF